MTTVSELIDNKYRDYSMYVLGHRAIPSAIDGFKTSQRKILYTAIKTAKTKLKTASLAGNAIAQANYHHGPASLESAISLMAADWANNVCLLEGEGNFGSRLVNEPAAARYTMVKLANAYQKYFVDNDLLSEYPSADMDDPEPMHYLPLIPWVLINGIKGIAIGHAVEVQPRNPKEIRKLCVDYLSGKNIDKRKCLPYFDNFKGTVSATDVANRYCATGTYELSGKTKLRITELPPGIEREKYIKHLDSLEDKGLIVGYVDNCSKNKFDFSITLRRANNITTKEHRILNTFNLNKGLSENLTLLDADGKLRIFDSVIEVIKYFCDWRLKQYAVRYTKYIERDSARKLQLENIVKFLTLTLANKIKLKDKTTDEIRQQMTAHKIDSQYHGKCLGLPVSAFSKNSLDDMTAEIQQLTNDIKTWNSLDHKEVMISELKSL